MKGVFAVLVASLAVLCVLYVLVSEDRDRPNGSGLIQQEKTSEAGDRLVQALMLRRQRQSDYSNDAKYRSGKQSAGSFEKRWYLLRAG
jgi:hypothetical protein